MFNSHEMASVSVLLLDFLSLPAYGGLARVILPEMVSDDQVVVPHSRHRRVFLAMY